MAPTFRYLALSSLVFPYLTSAAFPTKGVAVTDRYWDCCKPSCGWNGKASFNQPIVSCDASGNRITDFNEGTGCNGGTAFLCSDQSPWAVNDTFSYGFAGVGLVDSLEDAWCGACYQLDFTSGDVVGKRMIVQAHNTGYDVKDANRFGLAVPGGNTSYAGACATQYNVSNTVFGTENVGLSSKSQCDNLPEPLQAPCRWRFDWFKDAKKPTANFTRVQCPKELTDRTGTIRTDDTTFEGSGQTADQTSDKKSGQGRVGASYIFVFLLTTLISAFLV